MLKLRKLAVCKFYLSGGRTRCQGVSDYGLNLHWNIPLILVNVLFIYLVVYVGLQYECVFVVHLHSPPLLLRHAESSP